MADRYAIAIDQGSVWDLSLTYNDSDDDPIDLSGYSARLQMRSSAASDEVLVSLEDGDGITLGGAAGTIALHLSAVETAALDFTKAVYDLELVPGDVEADAVRILQGTVTVDPEVTR